MIKRCAYILNYAKFVNFRSNFTYVVASGYSYNVAFGTHAA